MHQSIATGVYFKWGAGIFAALILGLGYTQPLAVLLVCGVAGVLALMLII